MHTTLTILCHGILFCTQGSYNPPTKFKGFQWIFFQWVYISAMYLIDQSICLWNQFIVSYLVSTGNQPFTKKINYTTNQGARSKQQNLEISKNVKTASERLRGQYLKKKHF